MPLGDNQIKLPYDKDAEELIIRKRGRITVPFSPVSPLTNKKRRNGNVAPDVLDLLDQVSKSAFHVFNNLKFNRCEDLNITQYVQDTQMSKTERESLSRRVRELKQVDLIRRVNKEMHCLEDGLVRQFKDPRNTYIINPMLILCTKHEEAVHLWEQCVKEKTSTKEKIDG